ncbi:MAG: branched-chain amino acid ABC transporter permease [Candidatus Bathyarchaeia archaeon]
MIHEVLLWGLYAASVYMLLSIGLNMIFGVMKIVNFAHGELMILGAYATFSIATSLSINPYLAIPISALLIAILGVSLEGLCFRPILGTSKLNEILVGLALTYVLQNLAITIWGPNLRSLGSPYAALSAPIGPAILPLDYLMGIAITAASLLALFAFLRTEAGLSFRGTSQDSEAAMLMGVRIGRVFALSFLIGSALAAVAGSLWAISGQMFNPFTGAHLGVRAFVVVILGGLGSIPGAMIASLILGLVETSVAFAFGGVWREAAAFVVLTAVLILRPMGVFGGGSRYA